MGDYYRFHPEREDGGYLARLVQICREILTALPGYAMIAPFLQDLSGLYRDLQIHKHVANEERIPRLTHWFEKYREALPAMQWFEFAACTGSTLGIFALVARAFRPGLTAGLVEGLKNAYFPWVQGLHILLDYLIDQEEDRQGGDLNFCSFYKNNAETADRLVHFYTQAREAVSSLPEAGFHLYVNRGLLATYLADRKASRQDEVRQLAGRLLLLGGWRGIILFLHCYAYRRMSNQVFRLKPRGDAMF